MLRAIGYTVLICGASAGAALGLAVVHDASDFYTQPKLVPEKPVAAVTHPSQPETFAPVEVTSLETNMQVAVATTYTPEPKATAPRAPVLPSVTALEIPEERIYIAPTPKRSKAKAAPVVSTQSFDNSGSSEDFSVDLEVVEIARQAPVYAPRKPSKPKDLSMTWSTGVYR